MPTFGYQAVPMYGIIHYDESDSLSLGRLSTMLSNFMFDSPDVTVELHDENDLEQGIDITINGGSVMKVLSGWILADPFTSSVRQIGFPIPVFALRSIVDWPSSDSHG